MNTPIGTLTKRENGQQTLARARARAALIPDLLVEAGRVANNVFTGWHGRRKRGIGENFWQFRPFVQGETMSAIDWRRSARDEHLYVRDREWQAAHTIWFWIDESPSMLFQSAHADVSKQSRALFFAFALAEILARIGERLGLLGLSQKPIVSRNAAERLASILLQSPPQNKFPSLPNNNATADVVLFSDFLEPMDKIISNLNQLARRGLRGHLVHLVDPAEETFPYAGRIEFSDPETGESITTGNASAIRKDYEDLFAARIQTLRATATKLGWSHTLHRTDNLASQALVSLHMHLSAQTLAWAS